MKLHRKLCWFSPLSIACCFAFAGCLSRSAIKHEEFALQALIPATMPVTDNNRVLVLRWCEVAPQFAGRPLVYRSGESSYESDPYAGFIVPPAQMIAATTRTYFRETEAFKDVVESGSDLKADTILEIHVSELYGDFRKRDQPAAVLSLRMIYFEAANRNDGQPVLRKNYARRIAIKQNSAVALVNGWNQALTEILQQAVSEVTTARRQIATTSALEKIP
jgi:ABC-type uncharacterized transport system auxiliary subunit